METTEFPAVIDMRLSDLNQHSGRIRPELASGAVIRLVNGKTGYVVGYIVRELPGALAPAAPIIEQPALRTRSGRPTATATASGPQRDRRRLRRVERNSRGSHQPGEGCRA